MTSAVASSVRVAFSGNGIMAGLGDEQGVVYKCYICEHYLRYNQCTFRCGYPFCRSCVSRWYGGPEELRDQHPKVPPCLVCQRNPFSADVYFPGIHQDRAAHALYFPPVWHYTYSRRPNSEDDKRLPKI